MNHIGACALNGLMFGAVKWFYEIISLPMHGVLYCTFLGFTVTFSVGAKREALGAYLGNLIIGLVWVAGYMGVESAVLLLPISALAAKVTAFGLMSFVIEAVNTMVLGKTGFCFVPIQFAVVIGVFSQQGKHMVSVVAALLIGMVAALISKMIYRKV